MPEASDEKLEKATETLRRYLAVAYRVYERLEREGELPLERDESAETKQ